MFELSINEDIQKRARESVYEVLKNHGDLTYEAINEMQYLQQCINGTFLPSLECWGDFRFYYYVLEALRKYPPVPSVSRVANTDYLIPNTNVVIEKGTSIIVPIYSIHTDPEIYPDPEKYDPSILQTRKIE